MQTLQIGKIYQHYKGKNYRVIAVGHHSENLEPLVVYQALYDSPGFGRDSIWIRPLGMFTESVEVDGKQVPRFKCIEN